MGEYNKIMMPGNLTREPDLRDTPTGTAGLWISACGHHCYRLNDELKEEVCFIDIVAFGRVAERSKTFLQKARECWWRPAQPKTLGKRGR
jgi:single-strand DNA-binding protein